VSVPSREAMVLRTGVRGAPAHAAKRLLLCLAPALATRLATYHGAVICGVAQRDGA